MTSTGLCVCCGCQLGALFMEPLGCDCYLAEGRTSLGKGLEFEGHYIT